MIMDRKIVAKGPSEARAFSAISRTIIMFIPKKIVISRAVISLSPAKMMSSAR